MFEVNGVAIRAIEERDLPLMVKLRADPRVWMNLGDVTMINQRAQVEWFTRLQGDARRRYFIVCTPDIDFLGLVRMDELDWVNRSVRVGGDIVPEYHGRGFGTKMFEVIKKYCFDFLNMNRLWLLVLESNEVAIKLYRKAGFREEGRQRQGIFRDGQFIDYLMMSLLASERKGEE